MTDLASVYLVGFVGLFGLLMLFQEPIKKRPPPKRNAKQGAKSKRKGKPKKAVIKQNFTTEKPKKAKKQKRYTAPELSEYQKELLFRYELGRMGVKK